MKAYGLPRIDNVQFPDVGDIRDFALKSCAGAIKNDSGEYRGLQKNKEAKANRRRYFKQRERRAWKEELQQEDE